jgi:hypothetical protein
MLAHGVPALGTYVGGASVATARYMDEQDWTNPSTPLCEERSLFPYNATLRALRHVIGVVKLHGARLDACIA